MFCTHCGKQIDDEAIVCPHCGVATNNFKAVAQPQPVQKKANVLAIVGFSLSLGAFVFTFINGYLFLLAVLTALVLSIVGAVRVKACNSGMGFAIAGIVISAVIIFLFILFMIFAVIFAFTFFSIFAAIFI